MYNIYDFFYYCKQATIIFLFGQPIIDVDLPGPQQGGL